MRPTIRALGFLALLLMIAVACCADTGTYEILKYEVSLTPHSDGTVIIHYYLRWLVKSGQIPWITVGTVNDDFDITGHGGAVSDINPENQGGWNGVRIDLDQSYQSGRTFDVSFTLNQRGLFCADQESYRLDFTPGWYDRAVTDTLNLAIAFFAGVEQVRAKPNPTVVNGDTLIWTRYDLPEGNRLTISVMIPQNQFPAGISETASREHSSASNAKETIIRAIVIIMGILIVVFRINRMRRGGRYSGGRVFFGGLFGPLSGGGSGGGRSSGGGGGFGGRSSSCACACVSCACACACAGGGGAGCDRKQKHVCPQCRGVRRV